VSRGFTGSVKHASADLSTLTCHFTWFNLGPVLPAAHKA
jgi:hypothetical protein